jgi:hypothetical protein
MQKTFFKRFMDKGYHFYALIAVGLIYLVVRTLIQAELLWFKAEPFQDRSISSLVEVNNLNNINENDAFIEDQMGESYSTVQEIQESLIEDISAIKILAKKKGRKLGETVTKKEDLAINENRVKEKKEDVNKAKDDLKTKSIREQGKRSTVENTIDPGPKTLAEIDDWTRFLSDTDDNSDHTYKKSVLVSISSEFRAKLLKQVISNQTDEPVIARIYSDTPSLKNALIKGLSYIIPRNNRLFVRFTSITLENGESYAIDATALSTDGESGIDGIVDENIDGDVFKGVANTLLGVGSVIIDSQTAGVGSRVLNDSTRKPLEKIETDIVISLEKGKRFKVFFNETLKI